MTTCRTSVSKTWSMEEQPANRTMAISKPGRRRTAVTRASTSTARGLPVRNQTTNRHSTRVQTSEAAATIIKATMVRRMAAEGCPRRTLRGMPSTATLLTWKTCPGSSRSEFNGSWTRAMARISIQLRWTRCSDTFRRTAGKTLTVVVRLDTTTQSAVRRSNRDKMRPRTASSAPATNLRRTKRRTCIETTRTTTTMSISKSRGSSRSSQR